MERNRLENIQLVEKSISKFWKKVRIQDYHPGYVKYYLGHYPSRKVYIPGEKDWQLLEEYGKNGVEIINLWEWYDFSGLEGKGTFNPRDEKGLRNFIKIAHQNGLKVVPYVSASYFDIRDPNYNSEWSRNIGRLDQLYYRLDHYCPGSFSWRNFFLEKIRILLDDYGFDGIFNDSGFCYKERGCKNKNHPCSEKELIFLWEDFLGEIHSLVKKYSGINVLHYFGDEEPPFEKYWDYQVLGETIEQLKPSFQKTKSYRPYIIRYPDWSRLITNKEFVPDLLKVPQTENLLYAGSIPYLQFPWTEGGNWGEEEDLFTIPGVEWMGNEDHWTKWLKELIKAGIHPPNNTSIPNKKYWYQLLKIYKEMTKENSLVYFEVKESTFFNKTLPESIVGTIFVNEEIYLVLSNLGEDDFSLTLSFPFCDLLSGKVLRETSVE